MHDKVQPLFLIPHPPLVPRGPPSPRGRLLVGRRASVQPSLGGSTPVAEGDFDHPANGQKGVERAALGAKRSVRPPATAAGEAVAAVDEGSSAHFFEKLKAPGPHPCAFQLSVISFQLSVLVHIPCPSSSLASSTRPSRRRERMRVEEMRRPRRATGGMTVSAQPVSRQME